MGEAAVTYVRNITDVDDKINARAAAIIRALPHNEAIRAADRGDRGAVPRGYPRARRADAGGRERAGLPPRFVEPRATEHIEEMRMIIERLIARGVAYVAEEHVLFSVSAMQTPPACRNTAPSPSARSTNCWPARGSTWRPTSATPMDFVLWKPSGPQDPAWPSPAGIATPGRPGWHIECSAMAWRHLVQAFETRLACDDPKRREIFDIHGGGIDLVFPHHENEIAQTCCAFDTPRMANVWMHNGFLQVEGEKMSKSLGNFFTIHELLEPIGRARCCASTCCARITASRSTGRCSGLEESAEDARPLVRLCRRTARHAGFSPQMLEALADDLNTPKMIAELHALDGAGDAWRTRSRTCARSASSPRAPEAGGAPATWRSRSIRPRSMR